MKATLALLLSLCLVLVDVSFGDDNGNTETEVTTKAGDTNSGEKCERKFPKPAVTDILCWYECKDNDKGFEDEDDGTPCKSVSYTGICKGGWCVQETSRISARSEEPTEESAEPIEESAEPIEESAEPTEESAEPTE